MQKRPKYILIDKLHKGFVIGCVGLTAYGCYLLSWRAYRYFSVVRPEQQRLELLAKQSLLAEGAVHEFDKN